VDQEAAEVGYLPCIGFYLANLLIAYLAVLGGFPAM
jgi:hypothetical protein